MTITVHYFAQLREKKGQDSEQIPLCKGDTPRTILSRIFASPKEAEQMQQYLRVGINDDYAEMNTPLEEGDEVVFIPPVAGG